MDRTANIYDTCIKKVPILREWTGKEEWKEKRDTALSMSLLQKTISKQEKKTKTDTKDVE